MHRIEFELEQLRSESGELGQLKGSLELEIRQTAEALRYHSEEKSRLDDLLRSTRQAAAAVVSPEISIIDQEIGRLQEQARQLDRTQSALERRKGISLELDALAARIAKLEGRVQETAGEAEFEAAGDTLSAGMTAYLNVLHRGKEDRWPEPDPIRFKLRDRSLDVRIGKAPWSSLLGATLRCYFLMAYHYALLDLTATPGFNYPGLLVVDFPPELVDEDAVGANENYIIEPFLALMSKARLQHAQVIAAGRAFEGLDGAREIKLERQWA